MSNNENDENMKARDLIQGITEGDESFGGTPPGSAGSQQRPMPRRAPPGMGPEGRPMMRRMMGHPGEEEGPRGFFSSKETSQLKDIMILMLASMMGSDLDQGIAKALMGNQELDPSQLQHILDEAGRLKLPESHTPILQKIYQKLSGS